MSKRDRDDARGDETAKAESAELDTPDSDGADGAAKQQRPSGKRSARKRAAAAGAETTGDDAGGAVAVKDRPKKKSETPKRQNPFTAVWTFLKQVVSELRKVIWPTRRDMIVYTIVVLLFVVVITAFIAGIDIGFARLVLLIFG